MAAPPENEMAVPPLALADNGVPEGTDKARAGGAAPALSHKVQVVAGFVTFILQDLVLTTTCSSWQWQGEVEAWTGWSKPTAAWCKILRPQSNRKGDALAGWWIPVQDNARWLKRWKDLWRVAGSQKWKLWTWRFLRQAFFTGQRTSKMNISDGSCTRCGGELETYHHLFWDCNSVKPNWRRLLERLSSTHRGATTWSLLKIIDESMIDKAENWALLHTTIQCLLQIWRDRNMSAFRHRNQITPVQVILKAARDTIEAALSARVPAAMWSKGQDGLRVINTWIQGDGGTLDLELEL
ncbi:hypothetical protein R1sor_011651 [Riccia sorocarpa]|uniref:Reverse transcriptase zinc-binding domain-containing protein n=1 Tax=Riccia sorocarpa TaxID=122646 RepID=A0ABD3I1G1_9MARC